MNVHIGQVYIDVGVKFSFNHIFQKHLHSVLTENTIPSSSFLKKYNDYEFTFRMSAKKGIIDNELKGPIVFKRDKDIEYSIFLPYDIITQNDNYHYWALKYLFKGIFEIYDKYEFKYDYLKKNEEQIIKSIISDKEMFYKNR